MDVLAIATQVLDEPGEMEPVRLDMLEDDEIAHDDEAMKSLYSEFETFFDEAKSVLTQNYGEPAEIAEEDEEEVVPLNGIWRYALWSTDQATLFLALSHEDREAPVILMLGSLADA